MNSWTNIILHCSASEWGSAREIEKWHIARGFKMIGYHYVILNGKTLPGGSYFGALNGSIEIGRPMNDDAFVDDNEIGAHTLGYNANSIGVVLVGDKAFTAMQFDSASRLVRELQTKFNIPTTNVLGHCETASGIKEGKTCPNFSMPWFRKTFLK